MKTSTKKLVLNTETLVLLSHGLDRGGVRSGDSIKPAPIGTLLSCPK